MSEIGSGSTSKQRVEHNVSECEMKATKRRKTSLPTCTDMGSRVVQKQNTCPTEVVAPTIEVENQSPEIAENVGENRDLSSNHVRVGSATHVIPETNSTQLTSIPLQHAFQRNTKEIQQLRKHHNELVMQLKSDREREIRELLATIDDKYNSKHQEAKAEYNNRMSGLEKNRRKIQMNRLLAECLSGAHGIQQDGVSSSSGIQHRTSANIEALQFNGASRPLFINTITLDHRPNISAASSSSSQSHLPLPSSSHYNICISDDE